MKNFIEKVFYLVFTIFIFLVLWKVVTPLWGRFVPWNYKTDLLALFVVFPIMIGGSFILSSLAFKFIKESK